LEARLRRGFFAVLSVFTAAVGLLLLAFLVGDAQLFMLINLGLANPALDITCAYMVPGLYGLSLLLSLVRRGLSGRSGRAACITSLISGPLAYGLGSIMKVWVGRPRPFEVLPARVVGPWHTSTFSFPSTTTMLVFGFALPILYENVRDGAAPTILAFLTGFSVIYTGFHYPTDVAAAILLTQAITLSINRWLKPQITITLQSAARHLALNRSFPH